MRRPKDVDVAFLAAPYGFGPLSKALAVCDELHRRGYSVRVLCHPSGHALFADRPYPPGVYEWRKPLDLDELHARLVVSCGDVSTPLRRTRTRLVVLDSLLWLRGRWERLPEPVADLYLAQRFFIEPTHEVLDRLGETVRTVDAVLPPMLVGDRNVSAPTTRLFVYPGGLQSPALEEKHAVAYLSWVDRLIDHALPSGAPEGIVMRVPASDVENERADAHAFAAPRLVPSPTSVATLMASAERVLIAPGIETTLEAIALGFEPIWLPPLNATHLVQMIGFRSAGVGIDLVRGMGERLADLEGPTAELNVLSRKVAERVVSELAQPESLRDASARLAATLDRPNPLSTERFPLGRDGASQAADHIEKELVG